MDLPRVHRGKYGIYRGGLMKDFRTGVRYYTKAVVQISFPENDCCCFRCPLMTSDVTKRERCARTGEILLAPRDTIGFDCPLKFEAKEDNDG